MTDALVARAAALDAQDPLRSFRDEFVITDEQVCYLDGNSLGMPPKRTLERLTETTILDQYI